MSGQSATIGLGAVKSAIASIRENGGISEMETSAVGGAGRKGGNPPSAKDHKICDEFVGRLDSGSASTGVTGYNSGYGHTS